MRDASSFACIKNFICMHWPPPPSLHSSSHVQAGPSPVLHTTPPGLKPPALEGLGSHIKRTLLRWSDRLRLVLRLFFGTVRLWRRWSERGREEERPGPRRSLTGRAHIQSIDGVFRDLQPRETRGGGAMRPKKRRSEWAASVEWRWPQRGETGSRTTQPADTRTGLKVYLLWQLDISKESLNFLFL